ncbi:MAG: NAD(P)H-dependent oxidoreductase subunit E [Planctomycetes bacterium]|nr:NAD(P)H-dependent oxidoreductase subunit E [Planctomycetota bacterium]
MTFDQRIKEALDKYPTKNSALLPILYILQEKYGTISQIAIEEAAKWTDSSPAFVYGVFSFYTFYKREDEGKYRIWVCSTISCSVCGCKSLYEQIKNYLNLNGVTTTPDGLFTLKKAECLGACEIAPVVQFEDEYIGNADIETIKNKIELIRTNESKL